MFADRLKRIMELLEVSSSELAEYIGCDKSNISRIVSGARVPSRGGAAWRRLSAGILSIAGEKGRVPALCEELECASAENDALKEALDCYFYADSGTDPDGGIGRGRSASFRMFGEKLDIVMTLAGLSNVRLGRQVNLDASYISRFRSGQRTPRSNPRVVDSICAVLLTRIRAQNRIPELSETTGISAAVLEDRPRARDALRNWLCDFTANDSGEIIGQLINDIDGFQFRMDVALPPAGEVAGAALQEEARSIYSGRKGIQEAVLRFLGSALAAKAPELLLYSDESMDWMIQEPEFSARWASLMQAAVLSGTSIKIIHNVDRDLREMVEAVRSWLPLYMSGRIESYYCSRPRDRRFTHTLFVCPGCACVEAANVNGHPESRMYRFHGDPDIVKLYENQFTALLEESLPYVRVDSGDGTHVPWSGDVRLAHTGIRISESAVTVTRLDEPRCAFVIMHPSMRSAFAAYLETKTDEAAGRNMQ